jgi:ribonuclease HII
VFVIGVDENGLGPRLGPLVATAAMIEVDAYKKDELSEIGRLFGITDSKATCGFGKMRWVETIALALIERLFGQCPADVDSLLNLVALDGLDGLQGVCPSLSKAQCWSKKVALPVFRGEIERGREVLQKLDEARIKITWVRSAVACAFVLNREVKRLGSKFTVDLSLFERLVLACRASTSADIDAYCGLVGGIRKYCNYFHHLEQHRIEKIEEIPGRSAYTIDGVGRIAFELDADQYHLPVSLASMVGKYLRELLMERQNQYYLERDPLLRRVSGYHDPVTREFVEQSLAMRHELGISNDCFER